MRPLVYTIPVNDKYVTTARRADCDLLIVRALNMGALAYLPVCIDYFIYYCIYICTPLAPHRLAAVWFVFFSLSVKSRKHVSALIILTESFNVTVRAYFVHIFKLETF